MAKGALDTPPHSDVETSANLPPSPPLSPPKRRSPRRSLPTVDRLIGALKLWRKGTLPDHDESGRRTFRLSRGEFAEFEDRLGKERGLQGWWDDKVHYDWDSEEGLLVLRMPTAVHEELICAIEDEIVLAVSSFVSRLRDGGDETECRVAAELEQVGKGGSTTLHLRVPQLQDSSQESAASKGSDDGEKVVQRSPDAQFYHPAQPEYPMLVIEVAHSQQQKDLPKLAESYIIDSSHAIRAVIGFKLPYLPKDERRKATADKTAWVSVWRPGIESVGAEEGEEADQIGVCSQHLSATFRSSDGSAEVTSLDLRVADLLPNFLPGLDAASAETLIISVPLERAIKLLDEAETRSRESASQNPRSSKARNPKAPTKFRKRKRTPTPELSDGKEAVFAMQELRELEKDAAVDGDYELGRRVRRRKSTRQATAGASAEAEEDVAIRVGTRATRSSADVG